MAPIERLNRNGVKPPTEAEFAEAMRRLSRRLREIDRLPPEPEGDDLPELPSGDNKSLDSSDGRNLLRLRDSNVAPEADDVPEEPDERQSSAGAAAVTSSRRAAAPPTKRVWGATRLTDPLHLP